MTRCNKKTLSGKKCKRSASPGSKACWQHKRVVRRSKSRRVKRKSRHVKRKSRKIIIIKKYYNRPKHSVHKPVHKIMHKPVHKSVHKSIHHPVHKSVHKPVHKTIHKTLHKPVHKSVHKSVHHSVHNSIHKPVIKFRSKTSIINPSSPAHKHSSVKLHSGPKKSMRNTLH